MRKYTASSLFSDVRQRAKKAGHAPGTLLYTGNQYEKAPILTVTTYDATNCKVVTGPNLHECLPEKDYEGICWVSVEGLHDVNLIKTLAERFAIHPLTVEDILNVEQRPKVEKFDTYVFLTLKRLFWDTEQLTLSIQQVSIVFGKDFLLSFHESGALHFDLIRKKLESASNQRLRQQKTDYLAYRLLDNIVDDYFVVLECMGEHIEMIEMDIISNPTPHNANFIYQLKRQMLILRKSIWPLREVVSHLLYEEDDLITKFTRTYLRDLYDHIMQAIDTVDTFRDMLSNMLDMYLSGLTIRMNEIMKTLTIITTIFIPITALSSIYGMNLPNIPLMKSSFGFGVVVSMMASSVVIMMCYFRKKKWL